MRLEKHEDPDKIGVSIFKPMVLETYLELSNGEWDRYHVKAVCL